MHPKFEIIIRQLKQNEISEIASSWLFYDEDNLASVARLLANGDYIIS